MPQGSTTLHEPEDRLSAATRDMHRAIVSLMEELEAVDWYQQRLEASDDTELKDILRHNRDEEKEHAAMVLEWIRRHDRVLDAKLREFLFTEGPIVGREQALERAEHGGARSGNDKGNGRVATGGLGSLRGGR
jgi:ferritin-like protein